MKQKHIFTLALVVLMLPLFAPTLKAQSEFGVKGGTLYTGFNKTDVGSIFSFEKKNGFELGIFHKLNNLLGPIGLQTELLYQLKGTNLNIRHFCPTGSETNSSGYEYEYGGGYGWLRLQQRAIGSSHYPDKKPSLCFVTYFIDNYSSEIP